MSNNSRDSLCEFTGRGAHGEAPARGWREAQVRGPCVLGGDREECARESVCWPARAPPSLIEYATGGRQALACGERVRIRTSRCRGLQLAARLPHSWHSGSAAGRCRMAMFSLKALDPGSGRKIPAIWHGACACHDVFMPET